MVTLNVCTVEASVRSRGKLSLWKSSIFSFIRTLPSLDSSMWILVYIRSFKKWDLRVWILYSYTHSVIIFKEICLNRPLGLLKQRMSSVPEGDRSHDCEYQWLYGVAFRSPLDAAARCEAVCPSYMAPGCAVLFTFDFVLFSFPSSITSAHGGPALSCSSTFHLLDFLFLISCRLQFHHLEYFAYPEVIYLASSIIQSRRQEPESKTSPWAAQTDAAAS